MPTATTDSISGPSTPVLLPSNNNLKRQQSEELAETPRDTKRFKVDSTPQTNNNKKKRRRKKRKLSIVGDTENRARSKSESSSRRTRSISVKPASARETEATPVREIDVDTKIPVITNEETSIPVSPPSESSVAVDRLTNEVKTQSSLISRHEKALNGVQQSITCQVCLDLLYKPYALAPCGHVACHGCLVSWFTSQQPHDGAVEGTHQPRHFFTRKKTCPHCRAVVRERPVEVWAIKNIVTGLIQSGLLANLPEQPLEAESSATTAENKDPWKDIFRAPSRFHNGEERPVTDLPVEDTGMYDAEDGGIYRCLDCMHEIEAGVCSGCERVYPGHEQLEADRPVPLWDDLMDVQLDFWGAPPDVDDDDSDGESAYGGISFAEHLRAAFGWGGSTHEDEDEDEDEEEEEYEGSFIDDDGEHGEDAERIVEIGDEDEHGEDEDEDIPLPRRRRLRPTEVIELSDGSEEIDEEDEDYHDVRPYGGRRRVHHSDNEEDEDEDGEGEGDIHIEEDNSDSQYSDPDFEIHTLGYPLRQRYQFDDSGDNNSEEEEDDGSIPGPPARFRHLLIQEDDGSGNESE